MVHEWCKNGARMCICICHLTVLTHASLPACTHVCLPACTIHTYACLPVHNYACLYTRMPACTHVCLPVCLYTCMCTCLPAVPPSLTMSPLFSGPHSCFRLKFSITASRSTIPFRRRQRHGKTGTRREEVIHLGTLLRLLHLSDQCALDQKISITTESLPSRLLGQCCIHYSANVRIYALPITVSEASATSTPPTSNNGTYVYAACKLF